MTDVRAPLPVWMFEAGYEGMISVAPQTAALSPGSKITQSQLGKVPARRFDNGLWGGYDWRKYVATLVDVRSWMQHGANVGLRAGRYPGVDIDTLDEWLANRVQEIALQILGPAPVRTGRPPKRLLMYQTVQPFSRMRAFIDDATGGKHLIEVLGEGQQYLVYGVHPFTRAPYAWDRELPKPAELTAIKQRSVDAFFDALVAELSDKGYKVTREGSGRIKDPHAIPIDAAAIQAPNDEELARAVAQIPNNDELFPTREDYIKMGYAIRGAANDPEAGYDIFLSWALRWEDHPGGNDPETVRSDWRRMHNSTIGWDWIAGMARTHGSYSNAPVDLPPVMDAPPASFTGDAEEGERPDERRLRVKYSDRWLAEQAIKRLGDRLRYSPDTGKWLLWDGFRWKHDAEQLVKTDTSQVLHDIAVDILTAGQDSKNFKIIEATARHIESTSTLGNVVKQMEVISRHIVVPSALLDSDPWILNTPGGVVDLRTGAISQADPRRMVTKITAIGPDATMPAPVWKKFLGEATNGDAEVEAYLQRFAGYALTGSIREQTVEFFYGQGGNGKGTFARALRGILHEYSGIAPASIFMEQKFEGHSTDIAMLRGARFVWASELEDGKKWNEQRLKQLSGGDPITARFMRADNFTFEPQFKLLFTANHAPSVRTMDAAIRRRLHIVGFNFVPVVRDLDLDDKLKAEYPAILAWAIEGAKLWSASGLMPPPAVLATSEEYFEDADVIKRWIDDNLVADEKATTPVSVLFEDWWNWALANGERQLNSRWLTTTLSTRGYERYRTSTARYIRGIRPKKNLLEDGGNEE